MVYLAGIDNGTTSTKGVMIKDDGTQLAEATTPKDREIPKYGIAPVSEQNPEDWVMPACDNLAILVEKSGVNPDAIGISGQMHGLVLVDSEGRPLDNAIIWDDRRTDEESAYIKKRTGKDVGHFTIAKLLWVKVHKPEIFQSIYKVMLPEDYVNFRLTNEITTTPQGLSQMRLWNFEKGCLDTELLKALEIPESMIPEIRGDMDLHGRITREIASITGVKEGTPVYAKAGDQESAATGNGVVTPGLGGLNSGTSGIIAIVTEDNVDKSSNGIYWMKHLNKTNIILACTLACGASYQFIRDRLFQYLKKGNNESIYPIMDKIAAEAPVGSGGVIWLPYLKGERSPRDNSNIRAGWYGINDKTPISHLTRAVLEGVAYSFRHCQQVLAEEGNTFEKARATKTGLLKADLFGQILADTLNVPIEFVNTAGGCYGVALAAGVGLGTYDSLESACSKTIKPIKNLTIQPNSGNHEILKKVYEMYVEVGDALSRISAKYALMDK